MTQRITFLGKAAAGITLIFALLGGTTACYCDPVFSYLTTPVETGTQTFNVDITRFEDAEDLEGLSLVFRVVGLDAPRDSELRVRLSPGMSLVGTGPNLEVELTNLDRLLVNCADYCTFPVTLEIAETDNLETSNYTFEVIPGPTTGCGEDTDLGARLQP